MQIFALYPPLAIEVGFFVFYGLYFLRNQTTPTLYSELKWVGVKVEVSMVGEKFVVVRSSL